MKTALTGIPNMEEGEIAELYTFTLANGTASYFTTFDVDLPYRGQVYRAGLLNFDRGTIRCSVGVEVDDVTVSVYPAMDGDLASLPLFCNNGGFDGAWVKIERARQAYVVHLFEGMIADAVGDRTKCELTISAGTVLLNIDMPRNVYTPGCIYTVFDLGCGLSKDAFAVAAVVAEGSNRRTLLSGLTAATGYFDLGSVLFTSGVNNGATRTIRENSGGTLTLSYPLFAEPETGDSFIAYPGCDGRLSTCESVFLNKARFRGYPFIPVPEASV